MKVSLSQTIPAARLAEQSERIGEVASPLVLRMHRCENAANPHVSDKAGRLNDAQGLEQFYLQGCQDLLSNLVELSSEDLSPSGVKELLELTQAIEMLKKILVSNPNYLTIAGNLKEARNVPDGM